MQRKEGQGGREGIGRRCERKLHKCLSTERDEKDREGEGKGRQRQSRGCPGPVPVPCVYKGMHVQQEGQAYVMCMYVQRVAWQAW